MSTPVWIIFIIAILIVAVILMRSAGSRGRG